MPRIAPLALACTIGAACATSRVGEGGAPGTPAASRAADGGAFVVRMGVDTIAVERFERAGDVYLGEYALRSPTARLFRTRIELTPAGDVLRATRAEHRVGAPADAPPLSRVETTVRGDSATLVETRGDSVVSTRRAPAAPGALPGMPESNLSFELVATRAAAAGRDTLQVPLLLPAGPRIRAARIGPDSMTFTIGLNTTFRARIDPAGHILGLHGTGSTIQVRLTREAATAVDVPAIAARWARAQPMGVLSPADSVKATVDGAAVAIHYGRPSKRGRVVFGDSGVAMEPWGKVWRTGANEATRLTTDRDLVIGDAVVPAGTYTLWTLLDRAGWRLIVNRQTLRADGSGRPLWGTGYDPRHDLARTAMTMTRLTEPVEQLSIALEPQGRAAVLRVRWDTTEATVPVRAR